AVNEYAIAIEDHQPCFSISHGTPNLSSIRTCYLPAALARPYEWRQQIPPAEIHPAVDARQSA
ncbi:hypothetical protein ACC758_39255, partial [Rhizobium ruizarguesonis]